MITTQKPDTVPFPLVGPYMDAGRHPARLQPGTLSKVVGADGRYVGSIRPFPGMLRLSFGTSKYGLANLISGLTAVSFFKHIKLQRSTSSADTLTGFVIRATVGADVKLYVVVYDSSTSAWLAAYAVNSGTAVSATAAIDVSCNGPYLYIAVAGNSSYPRTLWYNPTSWVDKATGPQYTAPAAPTSVTTPSTGLLPAGDYLIAYRFYDSTRNLYSGMSATAAVTAAEDDSIQFDIAHPGGTPNDFDKIQIFRTLSADVAGTSFDAGILYKDKEVSMKAAWVSGNYQAWDTYLTTGLTTDNTDAILCRQQVYDPWEDVAAAAPQTGVVHYYQGTLFMGMAPTEVGGAAGFRWSSLTSYAPELFNEAHKYRGKLWDGIIGRFVEAGEILYAVATGVIIRLHKIGTQLSMTRLHIGRGATGVDASHGVGEDLFTLCPLGVAVVSGPTGEMQIFSQLDRIIYGDWKADLDTVVSAYDSYLGASFWVNTALYQAIVLWHTSKLTTLLDHMHFAYATSGPHPTAGGAPRAFFMTAEGVVVYPDAEKTGTHTNMGILTGCTLNGTVTTASATIVTDAAATFGTSNQYAVIGAYVLAVTGANAGLYRRVTANTSGTQLTVSTFPVTLAVGDRYAISPVPFELRFPPLPSTTAGVQDLERTVFKHTSLLGSGHSGTSVAAVARWRIGAYVDGADINATWNEVAMADGWVGKAPCTTSPGSLAGFLVEPFVGCYAAGVDFELTTAEFLRTMGKGRSTSVSTG